MFICSPSLGFWIEEPQTGALQPSQRTSQQLWLLVGDDEPEICGLFARDFRTGQQRRVSSILVFCPAAPLVPMVSLVLRSWPMSSSKECVSAHPSAISTSCNDL